jgi:reactive intermediate/imine deaminase
MKHGVTLGKEAPSPLGSYSHAVCAGNFVYLSGQGARDAASGNEVGLKFDSSGQIVDYDIELQTEQCLNNVIAVLKACDCTIRDLIDVSVYLKNIGDFDLFNKVYARYFNFANAPARTTIQAADLPGNNFIEIKAIAYKAQ